jgi:hypothetical protein
MKNNRDKRWVDLLLGLLIFLICLAVYNATLTPSLSYKSPDGNEMATVPYILGLAHMTGYPLYTWLGKLFSFLPIGDVAHRMNLMSAIMGSGGVVLLFFIIREFTDELVGDRKWISRLGSLTGALIFGFSLTFWSQTGIAEVYAPNVLMIAGSIYLILRWSKAKKQEHKKAHYWLWAFGFVYGLSLGTHMSNLGLAPGFALFILLIDWRFLIRPKEILVTVGAFLVGILQFAWLPYKAFTLIDAPMLRHAPTTLEAMYNYTLGAFPQLKFAFPIWAIPDRIVLYLYLLWQQFFLPGIVLGLYGMVEILFRKPKYFFLLAAMFLVQVFFFIQYRAFDLDVFFIPAHFIFAIFIGISLAVLSHYLWSAVSTIKSPIKVVLQTILGVIIGMSLLLPITKELKTNWSKNDYSQDTAINDFYENVWELLPTDSVLIGRGGVFGYDMFYFRLVYNIRPDVSIPLLETPDQTKNSPLDGKEIFSTTRIDNPINQRGPGTVPPELIKNDSWHIPVLFGQSSQNFFGRGRELVLYQVNSSPPELITRSADPEISVGKVINDWYLVGYDIDQNQIEPGGRIQLSLYWQLSNEVSSPDSLPIVRTYLDNTVLESHQLGLGNLTRYLNQFSPERSDYIQEDYAIVIPSTIQRGSFNFRLSLLSGYRPGMDLTEGSSLDLGSIEIK